MIRVVVSTRLIEETLVDLPPGAKLVTAQVVHGYVEMYFTEPGRCDDRNLPCKI